MNYLTAGESHGPQLTEILEGIPAGLHLDVDQINQALAARQGGYGRGNRQKIEHDTVEIVGGVRHGVTLGSPIALTVKNRDHAHWSEIMNPTSPATPENTVRKVNHPRPGHADLVGGMKYRHRDLRNVLERSSARETTMRVAVGNICEQLLAALDISIVGYVQQVGFVDARGNQPANVKAIQMLIAQNDLRIIDNSKVEAIHQLIDQIKRNGDTLGGVIRVIAENVPAGLGSHVSWDTKLDGKLAAAVMGVNAVKGVSIGDGFENAVRFGSQVMDEISWDQETGYSRLSNHLGGFEGGMTNGMPIIINAVMKPIPILYKPLQTVDVTSHEPVKANVERSDTTAIVPASLVVENVVAIELAKAITDTFEASSLERLQEEVAAWRQEMRGSLTVLGDKSISHRAVMLGSISKGKTVIHHFLAGDDCLSTLAAFNAMGVKSERDGETVIIYGNGIDALKEPAQPLDMGNSGTTTRLLMGILAGRDFETRLFGDASLQKRPMKRVSEPLSHLGARIDLTDNGTLPATIHGQKLHGTHCQMQVASAQVKSALIFAALQADTSSTIIEKLPTRNHTEIMLNQFGANIETATDQKTIRVVPKPELTGQTVEVPGDISSAAFFLTAGAIVPNSRIRLERANLNPTRTGIITVLQKMGADLQIEALPTDGEPLGNITIATSQLKPIQIETENIPAVIDELPLVALLAACADGTSSIRGAEELRVKETDRIQTVVVELRKLGVEVEELTDGMIIKGRSQWAINDDQLDSYGDHRISMMDAIAALKADRPLQLANADAVSVSYPGFFQDLERLLGGDLA